MKTITSIESGNITEGNKEVKVSSSYIRNTRRICIYFFENGASAQLAKVTSSEKAAIKAINNFLYNN